MKATDGALLEIARRAGVRATVIYHLWHYRKGMGAKFSTEGYCAFTDLPIEHGKRALAELPDDTPRPARARTMASKSLLPSEWAMPEDWLLIGRERRFWTMDVCRTEADKFANWHRMKGNAFADWKAAWRNWIDGSHRENGSAKPEREVVDWTDERKAAYRAKLAAR